MKSVEYAGMLFFTGIIIVYPCCSFWFNEKMGLNTYWIFNEKGK